MQPTATPHPCVYPRKLQALASRRAMTTGGANVNRRLDAIRGTARITPPSLYTDELFALSAYVSNASRTAALRRRGFPEIETRTTTTSADTSRSPSRLIV